MRNRLDARWGVGHETLRLLLAGVNEAVRLRVSWRRS